MLTILAVSPTSSSSGSWDSIHVFDAQDRARTAHYKLTSTVILSLGTENDALGGLDLSGNMVRQVEADMAVEDDTSHVANIGKMVEDMELKMRNLLQEVYFGKAKDVVGDLRSTFPRVCCVLSKLSLTMSQASHRSARRIETGRHRGR
jgi:capping protein beta